MRRAHPGALALLLVLPLAACGGGDAAERPQLTVLAAASLTEPFEALAEDFDRADVTFSFGSSTDLAGQAADGAPGDVLATADATSMQVAVDADATSATPPARIATNDLVIVTAPGNPLGIDSLDDLAGTTWVRCDDRVPCGRMALELLTGDEGEPASLEPDVKATLEKVVSGEADAGLVYRSDHVAAGDTVDAVEIPGAEAAATTYWIAPLAQARDQGLARAWVDLVRSGKGREALASAGFTVR